jgi:hypothetical protein
LHVIFERRSGAGACISAAPHGPQLAPNAASQLAPPAGPRPPARAAGGSAASTARFSFYIPASPAAPAALARHNLPGRWRDGSTPTRHPCRRSQPAAAMAAREEEIFREFAQRGGSGGSGDDMLGDDADPLRQALRSLRIPSGGLPPAVHHRHHRHLRYSFDASSPRSADSADLSDLFLGLGPSGSLPRQPELPIPPLFVPAPGPAQQAAGIAQLQQLGQSLSAAGSPRAPALMEPLSSRRLGSGTLDFQALLRQVLPLAEAEAEPEQQQQQQRRRASGIVFGSPRHPLSSLASTGMNLTGAGLLLPTAETAAPAAASGAGAFLRSSTAGSGLLLPSLQGSPALVPLQAFHSSELPMAIDLDLQEEDAGPAAAGRRRQQGRQAAGPGLVGPAASRAARARGPSLLGRQSQPHHHHQQQQWPQRSIAGVSSLADAQAAGAASFAVAAAAAAAAAAGRGAKSSAMTAVAAMAAAELAKEAGGLDDEALEEGGQPAFRAASPDDVGMAEAGELQEGQQRGGQRPKRAAAGRRLQRLQAEAAGHQLGVGVGGVGGGRSKQQLAAAAAAADDEDEYMEEEEEEEGEWGGASPQRAGKAAGGGSASRKRSLSRRAAAAAAAASWRGTDADPDYDPEGEWRAGRCAGSGLVVALHAGALAAGPPPEPACPAPPALQAPPLEKRSGRARRAGQASAPGAAPAARTAAARAAAA